jgi:flagellar biosynthesis chaperone FliJ
MRAPRFLARLLRIRELEEERSRLELEAAVREQNRIASALEEAVRHEAQARRDFASGVSDMDAAGRAAAVIEMERSRRQQDFFELMLNSVESEVIRRRREFRTCQTEKEQVEELPHKEKANLQEKSDRRVHQLLDDWYARR